MFSAIDKCAFFYHLNSTAGLLWFQIDKGTPLGLRVCPVVELKNIIGGSQ